MLKLEDWPKEQRGAEHGGRKLHPVEHFKESRDKMDAKLERAGEPPLQRGGFVALRLYTGPMFFKYNTVLRGANVPGGIPYFQGLFKSLCHGNKYPNTLHAITAAISKLARVTKCDMVYRAPGGILPKYFWEDDEFGAKGGVEMGFMSTSRSKDAAMEYAKFSGVKLIFEVNQGMVARGADVSWLSMYPKEDEVLFPPMCACEVKGTRVEGSVVFVELRPGVAACALQDVSLEQMEEERKRADAKRAAENARRKAAIDEAAKVRASWMSSMISVKVTAAQVRTTEEAARACKAETHAATESERAVKLEAERVALQAKLDALEAYHEEALTEATLASESRAKALEARGTMLSAQKLAQRMVSAAMRVKLQEHDITLKRFADAEANAGRGKVLEQFKQGLTAAKMDAHEERIAAVRVQLKESREKQAELQARTLVAEDKVKKLTKQLGENKKMLEKLMEDQK